MRKRPNLEVGPREALEHALDIKDTDIINECLQKSYVTSPSPTMAKLLIPRRREGGILENEEKQ